MIDERYYIGTPGLTYINEPELAFVTILTVSRNGVIYTEVGSTPTGNQFKYTSTGRIDFGTELELVPTRVGPFDTYRGELVYVKFKV
jgi:hypothetical protein